jgi:phosphoribosylamine--glycine ligase
MCTEFGKPGERSELSAVGEGLVQKFAGWGPLFEWAKAGHRAGEPTLVLFDSSGEGDKAEEAIRWGLRVIGGGKFMDRLEKDRGYGFKVAQDAGCLLPPYTEFKSFQEARNAAESIPDDVDVYWKSDRYLESDATHKAEGGKDLAEYLDGIIRQYGSHGSCMIQEKIEGAALSTARWWNGRAWVGPYEGTIEHKAAYNGDIGPATGCALNAIWFYDDLEPKIAEALGWENLTTAFLKAEAPMGLYDINAIIGDDGEAYFLEWTPRFGYDSEPTGFRLIENLSEWLWYVATGTGTGSINQQEIAYSIRLGVPPYPWEGGKKEHKHGSYGVPVRGIEESDDLWSDGFIGYQIGKSEHGLYVASPEGLVGLAYGQGTSLESAHTQAEDVAQKLRKTAGLSFRTDGAEVIAEDAERILAAGYEVPPSLLD